MSSPQRVGTLTILINQAASNVLLREDFGRCRSLVLVSQDAALTNVVSLQTGDKENSQSPTFRNVQSPAGTDITLAAAKAVVINAVPFPCIRINSAANEAAQRTWEVWGEISG